MKRVLALLFILSISVLLFAENFSFVSYRVDVSVSPDRIYRIREHIELDFNSPSHGIIRDIPVGTGRKKYLASMVETSDPCTVSEENGNYTVRLGSEDRYVQGPKTYDFTYTLDIGEDEYGDYDEVYLNVLGTDWSVPVRNFDFTITFPSAIDADNVYLTSGAYGSSANRNVVCTLSADRRTIEGHAEYMDAHEGITLRAELPEGYFVGEREIPDYSNAALVLSILVTLSLSLIAFLVFRKYGNDEEPVTVVRFDPPVGLNPCETGYIYDGHIDDVDITAMVFYWADKGYIRIEENEKGDFALRKLKEIDPDAVVGERLLFDRLMSHEIVTEEVARKAQFGDILYGKILPIIKHRFAEGEYQLHDMWAGKKSSMLFVFCMIFSLFGGSMLSLNELSIALFAVGTVVFHFFAVLSVFKKLFAKREYRKPSYTYLMIAFAVIITILFFFVEIVFAVINYESHPATPLVPLFVSSGMMVLCGLAAATEKRTPYGQLMMEQILGYREFLEKVEIDKLKKLIDLDPEYFYHNLSYAIVLGLEKIWAAKFKGLLTRTPDWYSGSGMGTDALFYTALSRRFRRRYITPVSQIQSEVRHGRTAGRTFHGSSGFSGGGAGGGGGRSW